VPRPPATAAVAVVGAQHLHGHGRDLVAAVGQPIAKVLAHHALLGELASTVQFNVQVQQEVHARTSGQRLQIWLLAAIVPGLFLYLRLVDRDFFAVYIRGAGPVTVPFK